MKNVLASFTDAYGLYHSAAVVEVAYGNKAVTHVEIIGDTPSDQLSISVTAQYRYWHSVEAKAAGSQPLHFRDKEGLVSFGVSLQSEDEIGDLEFFCLSYFVNVLLPKEGGSLVESQAEGTQAV